MISLRLELGRGDHDWLDLLPATGPFWYRARPERQEFRLGIGHALQLASAGANRFAALDNAFAGIRQHWRREHPALAFAGFAFAADSSGPLPNALLAIPAILLENLGGACTATLSVSAGRIGLAPGEWQQAVRSSSGAALPEILPPRHEALAGQAWSARVHAALRDIAAGRLDKVVLGRRRLLEARQAFAPAAVLGRLIEAQAASLIYAHGNGQQCFLGATPERLVRLRRRQVDADALAGTAWPGSTRLDADKNRHEQFLVVQAIAAALAPLCEAPPGIGEVGEHRAGQLRHLRSRITADVRAETTLFDLVRALHPTPAVGGYPGAAAMEWLAHHGEQRNGWYSGGFGLLDSDGDGEFSVALRSALLDGKTAELQAGAGIVAGSDAAQELAETDAKLGTLHAVLDADTPLSRNGTRGA